MKYDPSQLTKSVKDCVTIYHWLCCVSVRKSVVMLILVGIMLNLRYATRACKRRSKLATIIWDCCWRRAGLLHVLTSRWTSSTISTIGSCSPPRPTWKPCACRWVWLRTISLYLWVLFTGNGYSVWTMSWSNWTVQWYTVYGAATEQGECVWVIYTTCAACKILCCSVVSW